jgi:hypothetical protein
MIKIDKENFRIETDCKTVGEFMTQAAAIFGDNRLEINVDGYRYEFFDSPKIKVIDDTPLGSVTVERADSLLSGGTVLSVTTAPKPKTVKRSGWVNIYRDREDEKQRYVGTRIFPSEYAANAPLSLVNRVAVARIEWEEVTE